MPYRFVPINGSDVNTLVNAINRNFSELDNEAIAKSFKQGNGNDAVIMGRLPYDGGYGILVYDTTGKPRILIGIAPDGQIGAWMSKEGISILDAFS